MSRLSSSTDLAGESDLDSSSLGDLYPPPPVPSAWSRVVPPPDELGNHPLADLGRPNLLTPISASPSKAHAVGGRLPPPPFCKPSGREMELARDLRARLYDRPENSQVLIAVRKQMKIKAPPGAPIEENQQAGPTPSPPKVPRPPSGRAMGPAFRTTMFKKDVELRQRQRQAKLQAKKAFTKTVNEQPVVEGLDIGNEMTNLDDSTKPEKSVKFADEMILTSVRSGPAATPPPASPIGGVESPARSPHLQPSQKPDLGAMISLMRQSTYDDKEPEQDNFVEVIMEKRARLGWLTELPRHGPGCKEAMQKLKDFNEEKFETFLGAKEDDGSFVYALPHNQKDKRARYNPYDLQVVSANTARRCPVFWTASASNVTMNIQRDGSEESINTPTMQWMWERRLFHKIYALPVFVKYRLWKNFTVWKNNIRNQKNGKHWSTMTKRLFAANEVLQGCLLHVRGLCEAASGSLTGFGQGEAGVTLLRVNKSTTQTLHDFIMAQGDEGDKALGQLKTLRSKVVELVWEACSTVAEMEGVTRGIRETTKDEPQSTEVVAAKPEEKPKTKVDARSRLLGKYGFDAPPAAEKVKKKSDKPSYAQIAEWRKVLQRLSYFLRLVDYLMMELLRRLVITATRSLKQFLQTSSIAGGMEEDEESLLGDGQSVMSDTDTSRTSSPYKHAQSPSKFSAITSTTSSSRQGKRTPGIADQPYVIPQFDFDKHDEVEAPLDIEGVLKDIRHQHDVIEVPKAVLSVRLVLNVPAIAPAPSAQTKQSREMSRATRQTQNSRKTNPSKKAVKFTDRKDSSDESDYEESDGSSSGDEGNKEQQADANRFAYSEEPRRTKTDGTSDSKAFITLSPSEFHINNGIRGVISGFEHIASQIGTLLREPRLEPFYTPPRYDLKLHIDKEQLEEEQDEQHPWPDTGLLFGEDPDYQALIKEIMELVTSAVEEVVEYSNDFTQYCTMVDQSRRVDVDSSMSKKQWSTDEFQHVLAVHTEQTAQMNAMVKKARLGLLCVDSEVFCNSCLPFPIHVLDSVFAKLPVIAAKRNEDLLTIIKGASKKLDKFPASVEEFVEHLSFLGKMSSEMPALEREFAVVTKLYTIAKDFEELNIHPEELALYQTLAPSFQHLKSTILYAEAKKDDNIRKFSSDLDRLIHDIRFKILDIKSRVSDPTLLNGDTMAVVALEKISYMTEEVTELSQKARSYANYQERFGSSMTSSKRNFSEDLPPEEQYLHWEFLLADRKEGDNSAQEIGADLSEIERDLTLRRLLWESQEEWDRLAHDWTTSPFEALNVDNLQKSVNRFTQTVYMLEKGLPGNEVVPRLKEKVTDFKQVMPCVTSLRNASLKTRHWDQIERIIGRAIVREKSFTLGNLLEMNIIKHKDKIQDISTTASNEATLERMLQKVIDLWKATDFRLVPHTGTAIYILAGADDILAQLEESQVTIGTIRGSRYVTPIKGLVEEWERKLQLFARTLDEWMTCQRNWLYLEQIFTTPDIQRQLPTEWKLFAQVDKSWKDIMRRTEDRPNALKSATAPGVLEMLQSANSNLEKIQKCLEDYLEMKRLAFARFYFLSNDELLDILAQSKNPEAVQPHLGKCFGNIKTLEIKQLPRQPPTVRSITSAEGESIGMPKNVRARGVVEAWLGSVESGMFDTVKKHLKMGLQDWVGISLDEWVLKHPGQVVLTVSQIMFNKTVVNCFVHASPLTHLGKVRDAMVDNLNLLAGLVSIGLLPHKRMSINALLTINVHNRDILISMIDNKISRCDDFEWTRQLRYEWDEQSNNCNVMQSNASFVYGYEYLGCSPRLVITPLTDRCYLTLSGALHLHLGGSPAGPAGTGKTETVKDLAKAIGKQCVVFNCSEGLDFKTLGKFFSGLAQSGSWCCFDEFNRIDLEVLSVVAQQIHTIKAAKDQRAPRFLFEGRDIRLNMTCGVFITMNPSYAGRVELPDNLKSLFRQVAMMVPDYALIAEIMLFSEGFTAAKSLSTKIVNLYQLASKQLSQQNHYDFGMRAIKSVLVMAGQRKRLVKFRPVSVASSMFSPSDEMPSEERQEEESHILIHALRDANMPKFIAEDVPLFKSILEDLFPGIKPPQQDLGVLEKAISMAIRDQGLQHWPSQIDKVKQLHSQILVRHGVMLVGPTGGGKTTARNILQRAMVLMPTLSLDDEDNDELGLNRRQSMFIHNRGKKGHVDTFTVNPKCVSMGELYGETDPNTFEWSDGLISTATRRFAREMAAMSPDESIASRPTSAITAISAITGVTGMTTPSQSTDSPAPPSEIGDGPSEIGSTAYGGDAASTIAEGRFDAQPTDWKWIILDGPVDTIWVENLNTVLDDSKILCLANGERISLTPGMRLMFEVDDLAAASPATISRCAMVYMDPVDLGWKPYVRTWLSKLPRDIPESGRSHLQALFEHSVERGLNFVRTHAKLLMLPTPDMAMVNCLCNILTAFFDFLSKNGGFGKPDVKLAGRSQSPDSESSPSRSSSRPASRTDRTSRFKKKQAKRRDQRLKEEMQKIAEKVDKHESENAKQYFLQRNPGSLNVLLGKLYVFAYTWAFGGNFRRQDEMEDDGGINRKGANDKKEVQIDIACDFDNFVHEVFEIEPPLGVRMPASSRTIYSYFVDMDSGNFLPWDMLVSTTQSLIEKGAVITIGESMGVSPGESQSKNQDGDIVPTVDTVRYSFLSALLLLNKNPILLTGESGVGKSAIIKDMLKSLEKDGGTTFKNGTIMGSIFNFTDKNQTLLDNISSLTRLGGDQEEGDKNLDSLLGLSRVKQVTGIVSSMLQFSAQTTAQRTQLALAHKLIKKGRHTLAAPKGKKVIVFVDDLNMPQPEKYGAQPPIELLRQFMDLGGFYDTKKLMWKDILDVTLVAACGPPGGGRNHLSPRLLKHFCMLALPQPSMRSLQHIYQVQLGRFFQEGDFMPEVKESLFPLVSASIAIYNRMIGAMRPTPAKMHYSFNVRDLTQVIRGLLQADEGVIVNQDNCAQLFAHEATRVFHDRLVDNDDRKVFFGMLSDNLHDYFKAKWSADKLMAEPFLFCDFMDKGGAATRSVYRPVTDPAKLTSTLEELYMRQNIGNTQAPQLVFFHQAVEHILRVARVFRQPGGHVLMVGLDGTGKSTTVQLACYITGCQLYKLTLTRGYNIIDFREDLKKVCRLAGVQGTNTVFLLTDGDIVKESFLEDINCILNSGEVPDLFDNEEMDGISMELKSAAAESQISDTRADIYNFFIRRVKKYLHIVLTMSPAGNKFRHRCRMNPSLINCCTIDWFNEWGREACLSVAQVYFQNADFICEDDQDLKALKGKVAEVCVDMHVSVSAMAQRFWDEVRRRYYVTPSSYMELIRLYSRMLHEQKTEFMKNRQRLLIGLMRLSEANSLVGTMQEELVALGPKIEEKAKDTEMLLAQLEKDQEAVDQVREIVAAEEQVMKRETQIVQEYADECQRDLMSVLPVLQGAIASLDSLDKADIAEIRMYQRPPELVTIVMSAVNVLLQEKPDWVTAKQVLSDNQFLKRLTNYDKNTIPERVFARLKKYSGHPDFNAETVGAVSVACKSMCQWVLALEHYHEVYKMAKPKQRKVQEAKEAVKLAQHKLALKQASLAKIEEHLRQLSQQYEDSVNQREALKERKKTTALRLQRASVLIEALSGEKVRWAESVKVLDFKLRGLVGDTLVSAGVVAYLGAFSHQYRRIIMASWVDKCKQQAIPISAEYDFVKSMVDANQVLRWHNEGLPQDTHSTENAIMVKKSRRWPLLIDPQGQASKWIQEMEGRKLHVVQASDPNYMRTMERAIRVGDPVLLQDVTEDLDPSLKPILLQEMTVRGGHHLIRLGDTEIEYNQNFSLYMTTAMGNPHYLPAVCIQVTLINFIVTFDGLQEQLLSSVVKQERPQLETERSQLLSSIANDLQLLRDLEDKTLGLLQKSEGHILDDQDLVETLQKSKGMSSEIHVRVEQSADTEKLLSVARKKYLPVAIRGAVLYFTLADLAIIDVMYQFSLGWFQDQFIQCINLSHAQQLSSTPRLSGTMRPSSGRRGSTHKASPRCTDGEMNQEALQEHMQQMIDRLTWSIYRVVSVALFAHHQLTFSFMITSAILCAEHTYGSGKHGISMTEFNTFLQGSIMASLMEEEVLQKHNGLTAIQALEVENQQATVSAPKWVTSSKWRQCQHLEASFPAFDLLCRSLITNHTQWDAFVAADDPFNYLMTPYKVPEEKPTTPDENWEVVVFPWEGITCFQRLLVLKVLRPDTLMAAVRQFVEWQMGPKFVSSGTLDLREMFDSSSAKTPLIFILSPGSDPGAQLLRFAKELRGSTLHLDMISLGRGQGPKAEELIAKAQILKGRWLFLQNCHLAASWMPRLQTIVDSFSKPGTDVDPQFRMWLSSKPDPHFPISILQTGLKMTVEPPQGVKSNLLRLFSGSGTGAITERVYEETCPDKPAWKNLLFGLCFFNAVIHERKKYDRLGWNIPYEFNDSDLEVSVLQLQMLLQEQEDIPWPALWYLTGEVTYGGRVTDDLDRRCLHRLLQRFYHPRALHKDYTYSPDKIYHPVPASFKFSDVRSYIEQLPASDSPELFGMNENAEKAYLESQANTLIDTVLSVQPRLSTAMLASGGRSSDVVVQDLATEILRVLPETVEPEEDEPQPGRTGQLTRPTMIDISNMGSGLYFKLKKRDSAKHSKAPVIEEGSPAVEAIKRICQSALFVVLRQEVDRFNNLLHVMHKSLKLLLLGVKGEVVMSQNLEEAYNAMLKQKVPLQWTEASYESCKPLGPWVSDLVQRVDFFTAWVDLVTRQAEKILKTAAPSNAPPPANGEEVATNAALLNEYLNCIQPSSFWLPAFFFPQGFLTALQQNHARKVGVSVDSLTFHFTVINRSKDTDDDLNDTKRKLLIKELGFDGGQGPDDGVMVFGLCLDGARWNLSTGTLCDSLPGQRFSHLPQIHFKPVIEETRQAASSALESPLAMFKAKQGDGAEIRETYECPLYRTSTRAGTLSSTGHSTNFVTSISLPTDQPAEFWVMRGVALLCQLDD